MYKASIHDPMSDRMLTIEATTQALLRKQVSNEIDDIRKKIVDLFIPVAVAIVLSALTLIAAIGLPPFGLLVWLLLNVTYLRAAPLSINPILDTWYSRKRLHAWQDELERISSPDAQTI
ncbi:MAG TPA: hypothetical protein VF281_00775 [Candidatus Saccharimonadales bacterium]